MKLRSALVSFALLFVCSAAFAWPTCKGNWVQVPRGTGSANGLIYITGDNLTFQCQTTPKPPTDPKPTSSATSAANSSSNSAASSSSTANQSQGQQQGQTQTATGGNATENGNNSNNSVTNIAAPKIPVNTAYAPSVYPTVTCFKGFGAGVQTAPFGASFGGGKIDENCAILEAAKNAQSKLAFCKVYVSNKYVKKAGVTLADCLAEPAPSVTIIRETNFAPPVAVIPPVIETPALTVIPATDFGVCSFPTGSRLTNECKAILDTAVIYSKKASGGYVVIEADALTGVLKTQATQKYLERAGVDGNNILIKMTKKPTTGVAVSYSEQ